jgi:hypothetical protein
MLLLRVALHQQSPLHQDYCTQAQTQLTDHAPHQQTSVNDDLAQQEFTCYRSPRQSGVLHLKIGIAFF